MLAGRFEKLPVTGQGELDPVGDLEPGVAPGVLHGVDDLPRQALAAKLVVELELQADGVAGL